jgi:hypothetical protein
MPPVDPVIAMGGFAVSDPSPTLAHFKAVVEAGEVHYELAGGSGGDGMGGSSTTGAIDTWVEAHGTMVSSSAIGRTTVGTLHYVSSAATSA